MPASSEAKLTLRLPAALNADLQHLARELRTSKNAPIVRAVGALLGRWTLSRREEGSVMI